MRKIELRQGVTAELLKDIITIFYSPLAQVYKAASIADSLGDLQNFLNDMIRTVEQVEECKPVCDSADLSIARKPRSDRSNLHRPCPTTRASLLHLCPQCPLERSRPI